MDKPTTQPAEVAWLADSPLALETYVEAFESEQARRAILEGVLTQMRERLDLTPREQAAPTIDEIRAMFTRYQRTADAPVKPISQLVSDMREE